MIELFFIAITRFVNLKRVLFDRLFLIDLFLHLLHLQVAVGVQVNYVLESVVFLDIRQGHPCVCFAFFDELLDHARLELLVTAPGGNLLVLSADVIVGLQLLLEFTQQILNLAVQCRLILVFFFKLHLFRVEFANVLTGLFHITEHNN